MPARPEYPYYPAPYQPVRRSLSRWWLAAATAFVVVGLVGAATAFVLVGRAIELVAANSINDRQILAVVEKECDRMTRTVDDLTVGGSPHHQAEVIKKQNKAAQRMIDAVLALDPKLLAADKPTLAWAADWQQLLNLRSAFADQVELGADPDLQEPKNADGDSVIARMNWASGSVCVIPETLLNPYPDYAEKA